MPRPPISSRGLRLSVDARAGFSRGKDEQHEKALLLSISGLREPRDRTAPSTNGGDSVRRLDSPCRVIVCAVSLLLQFHHSSRQRQHVWPDAVRRHIGRKLSADGGSINLSACSNRCSGLSVVRLSQLARFLVFDDRKAIVATVRELRLDRNQRVQNGISAQPLGSFGLESYGDAHGILAARIDYFLAGHVVHDPGRQVLGRDLPRDLRDLCGIQHETDYTQLADGDPGAVRGRYVPG